MRVDALTRSLSELWIASLVSRDSSIVSLDNLLNGHFEGASFPLDDLRQWKSLRWSTAKTLAEHAGCTAEIGKGETEYKQRPIPNDPDGRTEEVQITYFHRRLGCYAFRPSRNNDAVDIAAEVHLNYRTWQEDGVYHGYDTPVATRLYFDVPPGEDAQQYETKVVQSLQAKAPGDTFTSRLVDRPNGWECVVIKMD